MNKTFCFLTVLICLAFFSSSPAVVTEVSAQPFFEGKVLRLVVYATPGGGYDTYARLLGRHLSKYILGNPTIIIQNMPGAGGLVATNHLYNKAPRDGTVFAMLPWRIWGHQLAGDPKAKFDFRKMNAVGSAAMENAILYMRTDRYSNIAAIKQSGKQPKIGCNGRSATGFVLGRVAEEVMEKIKDLHYKFQHADFDNDLIGMFISLVEILREVNKQGKDLSIDFPKVEDPDNWFKQDPHFPVTNIRDNIRFAFSDVFKVEEEIPEENVLLTIHSVVFASAFAYNISPYKLEEYMYSDEELNREIVKYILLEYGMSKNWIKTPSDNDYSNLYI